MKVRFLLIKCAIKPFFHTYKAHTSLLLVFTLAVTAALLQFWQWMPEVFYGDDLYNLLAYRDGQFASSAGQALGDAYLEKYRPVFAWVMWLLFGAFGDHIQPYQVLNVVLHGLSATLVFFIAHRLSHGNWLISLVIALTVAVSRFALYQVTQVTGLLEGVALALFLGMLYAIIRASENIESSWRWSWLAMVLAFLAMHTHERYIVIAFWLGMVLILLPLFRMLSRARLRALLSACFAMLAFNVLYKMVIAGIPVFVGTGGTHINIDVPRIWEHVIQAVLSIFGFNRGPEYLVGVSSSTLPWNQGMLPAAVFFITWLLALIIGTRSAIGTGIKTSTPTLHRLRLPFLLLVLGAFLLGPAILTIRLEQRWLLEPFILVLLLFAWAAGAQPRHTYASARFMALVIGLASMVIDSNLSRHFGKIFFITSEHYAAAVKRDIADKHHGQPFAVALFTSQDNCEWTLLKGEFFRLYGGEKRKIFCFATAEEANVTSLPANTRIYAVTSLPEHLEDVTSDWYALTKSLEDKALFDFLAAYPDGKINSNEQVESPSGKGVDRMSWDTRIGQRNTLTVISGFSYRYDAIPIEDNSELRFGVSMIFPVTDPARAVVRIVQEGAAPSELYAQTLTPPGPGEKLKFESITIPLKEYSGKSVSLTFAVESPGHNSSGHWIGFSEPRIARALH